MRRRVRRCWRQLSATMMCLWSMRRGRMWLWWSYWVGNRGRYTNAKSPHRLSPNKSTPSSPPPRNYTTKSPTSSNTTSPPPASPSRTTTSSTKPLSTPRINKLSSMVCLKRKSSSKTRWRGLRGWWIWGRVRWRRELRKFRNGWRGLRKVWRVMILFWRCRWGLWIRRLSKPMRSLLHCASSSKPKSSKSHSSTEPLKTTSKSKSFMNCVITSPIHWLWCGQNSIKLLVDSHLSNGTRTGMANQYLTMRGTHLSFHWRIGTSSHYSNTNAQFKQELRMDRDLVTVRTWW